MKYCSKCKNEMLDEAVVCVKCGSLVEGKKIKNGDKENSVVVILNFFSTVILVLSALFLLWGIAESHLRLNSQYVPEDFIIYTYGHIIWNTVPMYISMVLSLIPMVLGLISFVLALVFRQKCRIILTPVSHIFISVMLIASSLIFILSSIYNTIA